MVALFTKNRSNIRSNSTTTHLKNKTTVETLMI